jgi:hypothetical protein
MGPRIAIVALGLKYTFGMDSSDVIFFSLCERNGI